MSVPIVEGMTELEGFTTYIQYNSQTQTIEYLDQIDTLPNIQTAETLGDGVIDYHGPLQFTIEGWQPELEGGTVAGAAAVDVTATATGYEVATGAATVGAVSMIELLGGIFAGLGVGVLSYEANKDFWIDISNNLFLNVPGYVPITYDNIEDMSIMTLFKNGKTYVDYDLVQAVNNYLIEIGAFDESTVVTPDVPATTQVVQLVQDTCDYSVVRALVLKAVFYAQQMGHYKNWDKVGVCAHNAMMAFYNETNWASVDYSTVTGIDVDCTVRSEYVSIDVNLYTGTLPNPNMVPHFAHIYLDDFDWAESDTPYYKSNKILGKSAHGYPDRYDTGPQYTPYSRYYIGNRCVEQSGYFDITISGLNSTIVEVPAVPELPALQPRTISTTPDSIPQELSTWWAQREHIAQVKTDTQTGTKTLTDKDLLPITVPKTSVKTNNVTTPQTEVQTGTTPDTNTDPVTKTAVTPFVTPNTPIKIPTQVPTPTPKPTPSIPVIPAIGGQANALFTVYNPSQANLNSLGSVLWTENIIQQIVQMFTNNPMDAIISLHILYATPQTGANKEIKLGYLPTGVSCPEVTNQYVNVNCGTVRVPELFGDVRDYANTDVTIYLPMIGFRQLKTEDAMASYITVDYKVDVYTGTVLANVIIRRDSTNQVFYTFEGNCAVNLPLTGADKSRQLATAVGVIGATVMGSPLMGLASMAGVAGGGARANLTRSGNFTGNAGAMGCKKPYLIVSSDVPYDAAGYNTQYGYPANLTVMLGTCHGYVKAKEVHADSIANATEKEKREIENQLKQGVIIH